jgi:hypothetical protein
MENIIIVLLFVAFAVQAAPVSLGLNSSRPGIAHLAIRISIIVLMQLAMLFLGILLGNRFMFMLESDKRMVLFAGFFLLAIRYFLEVFKIRKGERTYPVNNDLDILVPSVAVSINTFLGGILLYYVNVTRQSALLYLFVFSLLTSLFYAFQPFKKQSFASVSLIYFVSGIIFIVISFYFAFF